MSLRLFISITTIISWMLFCYFREYDIGFGNGYFWIIVFGVPDIMLLILIGDLVHRITGGWLAFGWLHPAIIGWAVGTFAVMKYTENAVNGLPFFML